MNVRRTYECPVCEYKTESLSEISEHFALVHDGFAQKLIDIFRLAAEESDGEGRYRRGYKDGFDDAIQILVALPGRIKNIFTLDALNFFLCEMNSFSNDELIEWIASGRQFKLLPPNFFGYVKAIQDESKRKR